MNTAKKGAARAIADVGAGVVLASVEIAATPERVFRALTTEELATWWGSDDLYRTTKHTADLRVGGRYRSEGVSKDNQPFHVEGEYLELDPPKKIVQTWEADWVPGATKVTYRLEPIDGGTRVIVRHEGFTDGASCESHGDGWSRVLTWLSSFATPKQVERFYFCRLLPPRATFPADATQDELALMGAHAAYWREMLAAGDAVVFGPVGDPKGAWGLGVLRAADDQALAKLQAADPVIRAERGFRYESLPMLSAIFER